MVTKTGMRMVVLGNEWPRGTVLMIRCFVLTDDPGLVLNKVKVVTVPTQPAFPGRELSVGNEPGGTEGKHSAPLQG